MEVLNPPLLRNLELRSVTCVLHTDVGSTETLTFEGLPPFSTVFSLKQRISALKSEAKEFLPHALFIAKATEDTYTPVEFEWSFTATLDDPLDVDIINTPDKRLYDEGGRKPVFPTQFSSITLENTGTTTFHVWSIAQCADLAGYTKATLPTDETFHGYFQLYWPAVETIDAVRQLMTPLNGEDRDAIQTAQSYLKYVDDRYTKLDGLLRAGSAQTGSTTLRELRRLRWALPVQPKTVEKGLALLFYSLETSADVPFIRYFPLTGAPLAKVGKTASGITRIEDRRILDAFLGEVPPQELGDTLVLKAPIAHSRAPVGTCWSLRIYHDGTADLLLAAPRKDAPLPAIVIQAAFDALRPFLGATPWRFMAEDTTQFRLQELHGLYEVTTALPAKPSNAELRARCDLFAPIFGQDAIVKGSGAALSLRYKAVSNFTRDSDPIMNYITSLYLRNPAASAEAEPMETLVASVVKEFGISPTAAQVQLQTWTNRNQEFFVGGSGSALPLTNLGAMIEVFNSHPKYVFSVSNMEAFADLQRALSFLCVLCGHPFDELRVGAVAGPAAAAVTEAAVAAAQQPVPAIPVAALPNANALAADDALAYEMGMYGDLEEEELPADGVGEIQAAQPAVVVPAQPVRVPMPLAEGESVAPIKEGWYIERLRTRDRELFDYKATKAKGAKEARVQVYSRTCQKSSEKQPHVMAPETYLRARTLYGDAVFWVEAPLSAIDLLAVLTASKSVGERDKKPTKTYKEIFELEARALSLGFPLKDDASITTFRGFARTSSVEEKNQIIALIASQKTKPLWIVIRAGSNLTSPNYYICAEYWCVRDDLPLIPAEFAGATYRDGNPKAPKSCPFCGGSLIVNLAAPAVGETVIQRGRVGGTLAEYVGFQKFLYHPDKFVLPCCFTGPDDLKVPEDGLPLPPPKVALPPLQASAAFDTGPPVQAAVPAAEPALAAPVPPAPGEQDRPFTSGFGAKGNNWYIPKQNILGRSNEDWFELQRGAVAVPPRSVNKLLGQDPEKFLTAVKGMKAQSQNSYLAPNAHAFVRYGIGGDKRTPAQNFYGLIGFAKYATEYAQTQNDALSVVSLGERVTAALFGINTGPMENAFAAANYGSLLHEFTTPGHNMAAEELLEFQGWFGKLGYMAKEEKYGQRAYAENRFLAFRNFQNYVKDPSVKKELRYFEGLFAKPGLVTTTGFILVRIVYPADKHKEPTIICPNFGVSVADQRNPPPLLLVLEDEVTGLYDPLVFYEGKEPQKFLYGVLDPSLTGFSKLSPLVQEILRGFYSKYIGTEGCGRSAPPQYPWMPARDSSRVPRLHGMYDILSDKKRSDSRVSAQFRDRSNRLVGLEIVWMSEQYFIPVVDDGTLETRLTPFYGEEAIPRPPLLSLLDMLHGRLGEPNPMRIAGIFPAYRPKTLIIYGTNYIALEVECGAWIPIKEFPKKKEDKDHPRFAELKKKVINVPIVDARPWDTNAEILRPSKPTDETVENSAEEILNESYQHLRISFSRWILTTDDGRRVGKQIELLRQARTRLSLYELQKRLDILLTAVIAREDNPWFTLSGMPKKDVLRRDCLDTDLANCKGQCVVSGDKCLIHTTITERFTDPVRVCISRLVDELLRTFDKAQEVLKGKVSYLKPLPKAQHIDTRNAVIFATEDGVADEEMLASIGYGDRHATAHTLGYTFPEEVEFSGLESLTESGLPLDYEPYVRLAVFPPEIQRSKAAMFEFGLLALTQIPRPQLEEALRQPLNGSAQMWNALAALIGKDIILLAVDQTTQLAKPVTFFRGYQGAAAHPPQLDYVIVDTTGVPLTTTETNSYIFKPNQIPPSLREWIDSQPAAV